MVTGLVSIIMPVYNIEKLLKYTIDSILRQTFNNFELLLIDDGSTDGSASMCDEYAEKDSRIIVIHKENQGPSATRNLGIEKANGEFIVFVDSDDLIQPKMLEKMYTTICKYNTDLCICGFERFRYKWSQPYKLSPYSLVILQSKEELASVYTKADTNMFGVSIWAKMYRAEIIRRENIRFREDIDYEEDCCFNIDYFRHITTTSVVNDSFYRYRQMDASLSKGYRKDTFKFLVNGYKQRRNFLTELGVPGGGKVDSIFLMVIKTTLLKIFDSDLTRNEKYEEYRMVMAFEECQSVCRRAGKPKSRTTRVLVKLVLAQNPYKIHLFLTVRKYGIKVKDLLRKIKRKVKG